MAISKAKVTIVSVAKTLIKGIFLGFSHDDGVDPVTKQAVRTPCYVAEILTPDGSTARVYLRTQELCDHFNKLALDAEVRVLRTTRVIKEAGKKEERTQMFHDPLVSEATVCAPITPVSADALER